MGGQKMAPGIAGEDCLVVGFSDIRKTFLEQNIIRWWRLRCDGGDSWFLLLIVRLQ